MGLANPKAMEEVQKVSSELARDAARVHAAVREFDHLSPEERERKTREVNALLTSIQNNNSSQNKGTHVETLNIHTGKPMTPLELENMMSMAVPG